MLSESSYYEFTLGPGEAVSLHRTAGWEIVCVDGRVWLTEELGGEDVWLARGQRFMLTRPGRTVIESGNGATLRMCLPASRLRLALTSGLAAVSGLRRASGRSHALQPVVPGRI